MIVVSWKTETSEHGFTTDCKNWEEAERLIASLEADPNVYDSSRMKNDRHHPRPAFCKTPQAEAST